LIKLDVAERMQLSIYSVYGVLLHEESWDVAPVYLMTIVGAITSVSDVIIIGTEIVE